jgi:hypothetical protein
MISPRDRSARPWRIPLTLFFTLCWTGAAPFSTVAGAPPADSSPGPEPTPEEIRAAADRIDRLAPLLEEAHRQIGRDSFDPDAVIEETGRDLTRIFEWVRDHTSWVAYRGSLRGASGVLQDRIGNSLDRALLLAELLRASGQNVRLARAELPEDVAVGLEARLRPLPIAQPVDPVTVRNAIAASLKSIAEAHHFDPSFLIDSMDRARLAGARVMEDTVQSCAQQTLGITARLGAAPALDASLERARRIACLQDHYWVQKKEGEAWIDLDPLASDALPGATLAPPASTIDWQPKPGIFRLDPKLYHRVEFRLVAEQWKGGALTERPVLTQVIEPAKMDGVTVQLGHLPLNWSLRADPSSEKDYEKKFEAAVIAEKEWLPILMVGPTPIVQSSVSSSGDVNERPSLDPVVAFGKKALARQLDAFGSALGGGESAPAGVLTAEWIEYVIHAPGEPPRTIRRQLFDLLGPAARATALDAGAKVPEPRPTDSQRFNRGLALLGHSEMLITGFIPSAEFVEHLRGRSLLDNRKPLAALLRQASESTAGAPQEDLVRQLTGFPYDLYAFAVIRRDWSPVRDDIHLERPNVFARHRRLRKDADGQILLCSAFDIVANDVAVRPGLPSPDFNVRLTQGIVDTNAEIAILGGCGKTGNTADFFSRAGSEDWLVVRAVGDPAWTALEVDADLRARIDADLRAGQIVLVPRKPLVIDGKPRMAWWRIDPATGQTLGIGETGWGQSTTEAAIVSVRVGLRVGLALVCLASAARAKSKTVAAVGIFMCAAGSYYSGVGILGKMGMGYSSITAGLFSAVGDAMSLFGGTFRLFSQ